MTGGQDPRLTGGGLLGSQRGWSQVLALRRRGQKEVSDERILGSGDFVHAVLEEAEERHLRQIKMRRIGTSIAEIIQEECEGRRISPKELKRGGRCVRVSEDRAAIASRSKEELGLSGAEIARHGREAFGVGKLPKVVRRHSMPPAIIHLHMGLLTRRPLPVPCIASPDL